MVDHLQLSFQGARPVTTDRIGNHRGSHEKKLETAHRARAAGLSLTINAPVHRHNIEEVPAFIDLALSLGAERLEIANVQYAGWALANRSLLMPDRAAVDRQADIVAAAQEQLAGIMNIDFVTPDYFAIYPKPCMGGWARDAFMVAPDGTVSRAMPPRRSRRCASSASEIAASPKSGPTHRPSTPSAAPNGCGSRAEAASVARSTGAAAGVRHWLLSAMPPQQTQPASSRQHTSVWPPWSTKRGAAKPPETMLSSIAG